MLPTPDGDWRAVTWGAFARQIKAIGLFLETEGLAPGDRAAIYSSNRVEWMSAALGIQSVGGVMVPVYPPVHGGAGGVRPRAQRLEVRLRIRPPCWPGCSSRGATSARCGASSS